MTVSAKYVHTNLVAKDWKRLARFCEPNLSAYPCRRRGTYPVSGLTTELGFRAPTFAAFTCSCPAVATRDGLWRPYNTSLRRKGSRQRRTAPALDSSPLG